MACATVAAFGAVEKSFSHRQLARRLNEYFSVFVCASVLCVPGCSSDDESLHKLISAATLSAGRILGVHSELCDLCVALHAARCSLVDCCNAGAASSNSRRFTVDCQSLVGRSTGRGPEDEIYQSIVITFSDNVSRLHASTSTSSNGGPKLMALFEWRVN